MQTTTESLDKKLDEKEIIDALLKLKSLSKHGKIFCCDIRRYKKDPHLLDKCLYLLNEEYINFEDGMAGFLKSYKDWYILTQKSEELLSKNQKYIEKLFKF